METPGDHTKRIENKAVPHVTDKYYYDEKKEKIQLEIFSDGSTKEYDSQGKLERHRAANGEEIPINNPEPAPQLNRKKETVRINLPPKPEKSEAIKIPSPEKPEVIDLEEGEGFKIKEKVEPASVLENKKFKYKAKDSTGVIESGVISSGNRDMAISRLEKMGYADISIIEDGKENKPLVTNEKAREKAEAIKKLDEIIKENEIIREAAIIRLKEIRKKLAKKGGEQGTQETAHQEIEGDMDSELRIIDNALETQNEALAAASPSGLIERYRIKNLKERYKIKKEIDRLTLLRLEKRAEKRKNKWKKQDIN